MESSYLLTETLDRQSAMAAVTSNNVYVHSSPPKAISGQGVAIRQWVRAGDVEKLEQVVLDGQGARLLGLIDSTADTKVKAFLRSVPAYMAKVDLIHDAVIRGSLREIQALLDKRKLATGRDAVGRGLLHKAVLYNHKSVIEWLGKKYPETLQIKDNEGRTALHYTPASKDPDELFSQLISLGAKETVDIHGRKPAYYINHPENLDIEGPRSLSNNRNSKRPRLETNPVTKPISSTITRAQIRIWIHERDVGKLEKIVWSGHGDKLLLETTNNAKVKKFLLNVPHLLSRIKSIHSGAINNDVEVIKEVRSKTEIPEVFTAKDSHGLTALHKAAGLAHRTVVEWFLFEFPNQLLNDQDNEGRTPLHYAAKDNSTYNFLLKAGANETILDSRGKSPLYYKRNIGELDGRHLRNVPDAPRVTGELTPWDRVVTSPGGIMDPKRRISNGEFNHDEDPSPPPRITPEVEDKTKNSSSSNRINNYDSDGYVADTEGKYDIPDDIGIDNFDVDVAAGDLNQTQSNSNIDNYDLDDDFEPPIPDTDANEQPIRFFDGRQTTPEDEVEDLTPPPTRDESPVKYEKPEEQEKELITNADSSEISSEPNPDLQPEPEPEEPEKLAEIEQELEPELEPELDPEPELEPQPEPEPEIEGANEKEEVEVVTETDEAAPQVENITDGDVEFNEEHETGGITDEHMEEDNLIDDFEDIGDNFEESINTEDMEKLVELVLNGKGNELLNMKSRNPEVQEFITNIPAYMAKIASIHAAAASGNLRDLQTILDRKRLALAKDTNGLVPLHKAVLNSHSKVIRYLASNYNQSINATDNNGRTPLHYAATLSDSGATYKSLIAAGADPNIKDGNGNTPGIYLRNKDLLSHADLTRAASNNVMVPSAVLRKHAETWQRPPSGKRCTAADKDTQDFTDSDTTQLQHLQLIEIANTNPVKISQRTLEMLKEAYKNLITEESIWARIMNRLTNNNSSQCISKEYIQKYMTPQVFSLLSNRTTFYGATLLDVIKFYPQAFIIAPDPHAYVVYKELFHPVIMDHAKFYCTVHPKLYINETELEEFVLPAVDVPSKFVTQVRLTLSRNIQPFPFLPLMRLEDLFEVERIIRSIDKSEETLERTYLHDLDREKRKLLVSKGFWFPKATKISRFWPKARAFYTNEDLTQTIWVNSQDHLDIVITSIYGKLQPMFKQLHQIYKKINKSMEFHYNTQLGFLTVDPFRAGSGLKVNFTIRLPSLMKERSELASKCDELDLYITWKGSSDFVELENKISICDEIKLLTNVANSINTLIDLENKKARELILLEKEKLKKLK